MEKRGFMWDNLGWAILALAILIIVVVGIFILQGKGSELLDIIKNLFRFGR
jgi:hypothetical protein